MKYYLNGKGRVHDYAKVQSNQMCVCVGFFESYVVQHLNGTRLHCVCVYYNFTFFGANSLTPGTRKAETSLIMVQFDYVPVVAKNCGHNLHPQLLAHMCVRATKFRTNFRTRARQSMSHGTMEKVHNQTYFC